MDEEMMQDENEVALNETTQTASDDKAISSDLIRGHINTIILRSLYDGDKYGYEIIAEIERKSHGQYSMKQPSLYSALKRLESQGFITSYWGGSVGGGRRKYFSLTEEGRGVSERNQSEWEYSRTVIDSLISDKEFDFSNPAPTAVDMRVLKKSTTRVSGKEESEEELNFASGLSDEERLRFEEERMTLEREFSEQRTLWEEEKRALTDEQTKLLAEIREREIQLEEERTRSREELEERERQLEEEKEALRSLHEQQSAQESMLREEQQTFDEKQKELQLRLEQEDAERIEELRLREQELEERRKIDAERIARQEQAMKEERERYQTLLNEREQWLEEQRVKHAQDLEAQEQRIREEQAREFAAREKRLIHQNYLQLVNTPPTAEEEARYDYYTQPVASDEEVKPAVESVTEAKDYRQVVQQLYANSIHGETTAPQERQSKAQSLGRIDFYDLEERAAQDGIKINTAGGSKKEREEQSESVIHKGKVLFLSAIVTFIVCLAEGSVLLALLQKVALPVFYPYFVWAVGLAVLLITGLAYANRYGARTLRQAGNTLINCSVAFVLLTIFTLVLALAVKIDFSDIAQLATFVIVPIVFFFNIVIFAIAYVLQVHKRK